MTVHIRKMQVADIPQVQHIAQLSWHHTYEGILPVHIRQKFLEDYYNASTLLQRLENSIMYVAEKDDTICGFANYLPVDAEGNCELASIYLNPQLQGKGIGTALLEEAIQTFNGLKAIQLIVERDNTIGMRFYKSKGFQIVEEFEEDFEGQTLYSVRMMLKIHKF